MTISVVNRDPEASYDLASQFVHPRFTLTTDSNPVDPTTIRVWLNGEEREPGLETTGIGGYNVVLVPREPFVADDRITVRVVANDTSGTAAIDETWVFDTIAGRGPYASSIVPPPGSIVTSSPTHVTFDLRTAFAGKQPTSNIIEAMMRVDLDGNQISHNHQGDTEFLADGEIVGGSSFFSGTHVFDEPDIGKWIWVLGKWYRIRAIGNLPPPGTHAIIDGDVDPASVAGLDWTLRDHNLELMLGRRFRVFGGGGDNREIVSVQGPGLATYDDADIGGNELIHIYRPWGVDIYVDGLRVLHSGIIPPQLAAGGWWTTSMWFGITRTLSYDVGGFVGFPVTWAAGTRVPVSVLAPLEGIVATDTEPLDYSRTDFYFDVIDTRGPQVSNISPSDGAKGLDRLATPNSDVAFDITCSEGVDSTSIDIAVDGTAAVTAGVGTGDYSTSTVAPITDGYRVTLKKTTDYIDGATAFVDVQCADTIGREGEHRILRFHFGTTTGGAAVNHALAGDIVRVLAYDLSQASFGTTIGHTGFAWDGYWYENGSKTQTTASWYDELGAFPVSGHVVVTTVGWAIVKALDSAPWMSCLAATSPDRSMAGQGTVNDAAFGPDAVLAVASDVVVVVDFEADRAEIFDTVGRVIGTTDIEHRDDDQVGSASDSSYALPTGPYTHLGAVRDSKSLVMALGTSGNLTLVHALTTAMTSTLLARESLTALPDPVVTRASVGTWQRLVLAPLVDTNFLVMATAYNDSGQGQVEIWDWLKFARVQVSELFLDDGTTPAIATAEIRDIDLVQDQSLYLAAAMVGEVDVLDYDGPTIDAYAEAALGLSGVAGAELSSVALEANFTPTLGHMYAGVAAAADGRVSRFAVHTAQAQVVDTGNPATSLSAAGNARHNVDGYVRLSMEIA